ncbi:RHS repeat domain-containing protein, partial [Tenacibaculum maritimum]
MYDEEGEQVWEHSLDLNGKVINGSNAPCPFLYQGQYYDKEIELAYNRFRYYDPDDGRYISKDPIGLLSGEYGFYNYVGDS